MRGRVALVFHAGVGDPDELAPVRIARVDFINRAPAVGRVHETVVNQRIQLVFRAVLPDVLHAAERQRPDHPKVLDIFAVDLRKLGVPGCSVIAVHHQPVLRLILRVDQPVLVDGHVVLGKRRNSERDRQPTGESRDSQRSPHIRSHDDLLLTRIEIQAALVK